MSSDFQLDYGGFVVGVHAPDAADREWLTEYLTPQCVVTRDKRADAEVSFVVDAVAYAELEKRGRAVPNARRNAFVLDTSTLRFPDWSNADPREGTCAAFDARRRSFYEVGPGPRVRITSDIRELARLSLLRSVREFVMHAMLRRGDVFLHAACFSVAGRCVVIAGVKGAGKTTTLTWCLELLEKAGFVANDRVHMRAVGAGYEVRGMPTVMTFRQASLGLLPRFAERLAQAGGDHRLSSSEAATSGDQGAPRAWADGRVGVAPKRYAELLGRNAVASGRAAAIVFPEVATDDTGLETVALTPEAGSQRISSALFGVSDLHRRSQLFDHPASGDFPSAATIRERAARIVAHVPSYAWRVGSAAPGDTASLQGFVEKLR